MTLCCGHGFCKSCLDGQRQVKSVSYACPMCHKGYPEFETFLTRRLGEKSEHFTYTVLIRRKVVNGRVN